MTKIMPKVSIGVMTYNHEDYIVDCLNSIHAQSYPNIEVVISDDCSTDSNVAVINNYLKEHPTFKATFYAQEKNLGITPNCNFIYDHCHGDYRKVFAGDDIMHPDYVSEMVSALDNNPDHSFAYCNMHWFKKNPKKPFSKHFGLVQKPPQNLNDVASDNSLPSPAFIMRASMLPRSPFDERFTIISDYKLGLDMMAKGKGGLYVDEPFIYYRKHDNSITSTNFFTKDRATMQHVLTNEFPQISVRAKRFNKAMYHYAVIRDHLVNNEKKEAFAKLPTLFPYNFSSLKWLARTSLIILNFLRF